MEYQTNNLRKIIREILLEKWTKKYKKSINCSNPKGFSQKAHCDARKKRQKGEETKSKSPFNEYKNINEEDPKYGTGKKPKDSDRRLYTDENPKDTVPVKFRTKEDIVKTLNRDDFKSKSHARKSQIINLIQQRLKVAYDKAKNPEVKSRLKRGLDYIEKKREQSKDKTKKLKELKEELNNDFDRVEYYLEYYKNLTPSDFSVLREDDKIIISNIIK
jgi:hypothetical protein